MLEPCGGRWVASESGRRVRMVKDLGLLRGGKLAHEKQAWILPPAEAEASWALGMVQRGEMSTDEMRRLIDVPTDVAEDLRERTKRMPVFDGYIRRVLAFRKRVLEQFERLLSGRVAARTPTPVIVRRVPAVNPKPPAKSDPMPQVVAILRLGLDGEAPAAMEDIARRLRMSVGRVRTLYRRARQLSKKL